MTIFMVVDYDDFIHKDISLYVNKHQNENGWYIDKGYFYSGGNVLIKTKNSIQNVGLQIF